jgi:hypothetical protein
VELKTRNLTDSLIRKRPTRALATQIHEYRDKIHVARSSKDKTAEAIKWGARIKEADRYIRANYHPHAKCAIAAILYTFPDQSMQYWITRGIKKNGKVGHAPQGNKITSSVLSRAFDSPSKWVHQHLGGGTGK